MEEQTEVNTQHDMQDETADQVPATDDNWQSYIET